MESVSTCENKVEQHFTLLKWVGKKYKTLINNMVVDNKFVEATKANLCRPRMSFCVTTLQL